MPEEGKQRKCSEQLGVFSEHFGERNGRVIAFSGPLFFKFREDGLKFPGR